MVAASGNVLIQAHQGDIEITATGKIRISSGQGIEFFSPEVKIATKGAQADFGNGKIFQQCSGRFCIKSENFLHTTGGEGNISELKFPSTVIETDQRIILYHSQNGAPVAGRRYRIILPDGSRVEGTTDEQGRTKLITAKEMGELDIEIFPEEN